MGSRSRHIIRYALPVLLAALLLRPSGMLAQGDLHTPLLDPSRAGFVNMPEPALRSVLESANVSNALYTGALKVSVPLYTLNFYDLTLPLALQYYSNGLRVDEQPGNMGMTWNLSSGGAIHRTVRGYPDELISIYNSIYRELEPELLIPFTDIGEDTLDVTTTINTRIGIWYETEADSVQDWKPDLFSFVAGPCSGTFYIHPQTREPVISCDQQVLIDMQLDTLETIFPPGGISQKYEISSFSITIPGGTKYIYDLPSEVSETYHADVAVCVYKDSKGFEKEPVLEHYGRSVSPMDAYRDSWHLTVIESPVKDRIYLNYSQEEEMECWTGSQIGATLPMVAMGDGALPPPVLPSLLSGLHTQEITFTASQLRSKPYVLKDIQAGGYKITFDYRQTDVEGAWYSSLLEGLRVFYGSEYLSGFRFEYDSYLPEMPAEMPYYFGYDKFDFRTNILRSYSNSFMKVTQGVRYRSYLKRVRQVNAEGHSLQPLSFEYNNPQDLPPRLSFQQNYFGLYTSFSSPRQMLLSQPEYGEDISYNKNVPLPLTEDHLERGLALYFLRDSVVPEPQNHSATGLLSEMIFPEGGRKIFTWEEKPWAAVLQKVENDDGTGIVSDMEYIYAEGAVPLLSRPKMDIDGRDLYMTMMGKGGTPGMVGYGKVTELLPGGERTEYSFRTAAQADNVRTGFYESEPEYLDYSGARGGMSGKKVYGQEGVLIEESDIEMEILENSGQGAPPEVYTEEVYEKFLPVSFTKRLKGQKTKKYIAEGEAVVSESRIWYDEYFPTIPRRKKQWNMLDTLTVVYTFTHDDEAYNTLTARNIHLPLSEESFIGERQADGKRYVYELRGQGAPPILPERKNTMDQEAFVVSPYVIRELHQYDGREYRQVFWGEEYHFRGWLQKFRTLTEPPVRIRYNSSGFPMKVEKGLLDGGKKGEAGSYSSVEYTYDRPGRVKSVRRSDGFEQSYEYDDFGRLTRVIDGEGFIESEQYYLNADLELDTASIGNMKVGADFTVGRSVRPGMKGNAAAIQYRYTLPVLAEDGKGEAEGKVFDMGMKAGVDHNKGLMAGFKAGLEGNPPVGFEGGAMAISNTEDLREMLRQKGGKGVQTAITYVDGLSRPVQSVLLNGTTSGKDVLSFTEYDYLGREKKRYLPLVLDSYKGDMLSDPEGRLASQHSGEVPWSEVQYDAFGRLQEQGGLGKEFQPGTGHTALFSYALHREDLQTREYVRDSREHHPKTYPPGSVLISAKEAFGKEIRTYTSVSGLKLLEEMRSEDETLQTWYVYDEYRNLTCVIPPVAEGDVSREEYTYRYYYDERNRLVEKYIPGAGITRYGYDEKDRISLVENSAGETAWIAYDDFNRPLTKGLLEGEERRPLVQYWYDGYQASFVPQIGGPPDAVAQPEGKLTAMTVEMLGTESRDAYVYYYDAKGRLLQEYLLAYDGTEVVKDFSYAFDGKLMEEEHMHHREGADLRLQQWYEYYENGQLRRIRQSVNGAEPVILASYEYDERGQMVAKNQGGKFRTSYSWNYQGWLESIVSEDRFRQEMYYYDLPEDSEAEARWDGNIASLMHSVGGDEHSFDIGYDPLNRLLAVTHKAGGSGGSGYGTAYEYDKAGNIQSLLREHVTHSMESEALNELAYTYEGNRLHEVERLNEKKVEVWPGDLDNNGKVEPADILKIGIHMGREVQARDSGSIAWAPCMVINDSRDSLVFADANGDGVISLDDTLSITLNKGREHLLTDGVPVRGSYTYDEKGNMVADSYKGMQITYNYLNLPERIEVEGRGRVENVYRADGVLLERRIYDSGDSLLLWRRYRDYLVEESDRLFLKHAEGFVAITDTISYFYVVTDHLLNTRLIMNAAGETVRELSYYPFGLVNAELSSVDTTGYDFLFTGKEWISELGIDLYDYGARYLDPELGRWGAVDPMAEKYVRHSPYNGILNNPFNGVDLFGMEVENIDVNNKEINKLILFIAYWDIYGDSDIAWYDAIENYFDSNGKLPNTVRIGNTYVLITEGTFYGYSNFGGNQSKLKNQENWGSGLGISLDVAEELFYSKKYGTWMGKNFRIYKQTWGGNGITGGKNKFGKNTSNILKWSGRALGAWNAYKIHQDFAKGELKTGWMMAEQGSNAISVLGGVHGAAWGIGWELGRLVTTLDAYQELKFNYWYNWMEKRFGPPSPRNEEYWYMFFNN